MNRRPTPPHASNRPRRTRVGIALAGALGLVALGACSDDATTTDIASPGATGTTTTDTAAETRTPDATVDLMDADGADVGAASFIEADGVLEVTVDLTDAEPGLHGLHLHAVGVCEPDSAAPDDPSDTGAFLSAGGHVGGDDSDHPDHDGDLPSILVMEDGTASLTFETDRLTLADLDDEDGTAMMLHEDTDNHANIPDRYSAEGPDEDTLGTGDAGGRAACGVVQVAG